MRALVLLSGGLDSTVALFWALNYYPQVDAITFNYGQRSAAAEMMASARVWDDAGGYMSRGDLEVVALPTLFARTSSILGAVPVSKYADAAEAGRHTADDPAYVPLRNAVFGVVAAHHLLVREPEGGALVLGIRGDGVRSYPDDTSSFALALTHLTSQASGKHVVVMDPLNQRNAPSRADTITMGLEFRGCAEAMGHSLSCFDPWREFESKVWTPCGRCLPCLRRAEAFRTVGVSDPAAKVDT